MKKQYFAIVIPLLVIIDQLIKWLVVEYIDLGTEHPFIPFILSLTHLQNIGGAWSIMPGETWFFTLMALIVVVVATFFLVKNQVEWPLYNVALAMIIAGGIGNAIDRVRFGEVIDMFQVKFFEFPVFNFADVLLVVGVAVLFVYYIFIEKEKS
ncbi:MAG: signal peptidase II [Lactobacillales bacterium]|jgi:signal peptidase II|nr:signal peptidase II [Lactobacillales bacterium]